MCLATAYTNNKGVETVVAEYVATVEFKNGQVILTDILGEQTAVDGILKAVDLSKNTVEIICTA